MTNNKAMERADIIAALRCCQTTNCLKCPCRGRAAACKYPLLGAAADLLEHFRGRTKMVEPNDPLTLEELNTRQGVSMERKTFSPCPYCNGRDNNCADCEVQAYRALGTVEELTRGAALREAQDEGLIQPMSCTGCRYDQTSRLREHEAHCMRCIRNRYPDDHYTMADEVRVESAPSAAQDITTL